MNNLYGNGGFYWFMGVVEDRQDPEFLGRCRLRIAGYHTSDKTILKTEDLPWAMPLLPMTSASMSGVGNAPVGPVEGTWVFGFFMDGEEAQIPIMLGTYPGKSLPLNLLTLVSQLMAALTAPLTTPAKGLTATAIPTLDILQRDYDRETEQLANQVTIEGGDNV
jgi:hypothetical protein